MARDDILPYLDRDGVAVHAIAPYFPIHDLLTIHPGLIRINYGYGYMTAADVMTRPLPGVVDSSVAITKKRLEILILEDYLLPNVDRGLPFVDEAKSEIRVKKEELRALLLSRSQRGGVLYPDAYRWCWSWEEHRQRSAADLNANHPLFVAAGDVVALVTDFPGNLNGARVLYRADDGHIWELYLPSATGAWASNDLTQMFGGTPAAGDVVALVTDFPGNLNGARVLYRADDGHIWELYLPSATGAWASNDLTSLG
jgi:hypothetical protein